MKTLVILCMVIGLSPGAAAPPTTCGATDDYGKALCAYQRRNFAAAEAGFRAIVERGLEDPQTLHATYFLARTEMKRGRFDQASALLIRIHALDKASMRRGRATFCSASAGRRWVKISQDFECHKATSN